MTLRDEVETEVNKIMGEGKTTKPLTTSETKTAFEKAGRAGSFIVKSGNVLFTDEEEAYDAINDTDLDGIVMEFEGGGKYKYSVKLYK